jgi:hypothetical protein
MQTVTLDRVRIEEVLRFLSTQYSKVLKKIWREGDKIYATFVHQEYVFRTSSNQTITTLVEYDQSIEKGLCTIVASGGGKGLFQLAWGSEFDGERTVKNNIVKLTKTDAIDGKR